eukprot:gene6931-biopygen9069
MPRRQGKRQKDFATADALRQELRRMGVDPDIHRPLHFSDGMLRRGAATLRTEARAEGHRRVVTAGKADIRCSPKAGRADGNAWATAYRGIWWTGRAGCGACAGLSLRGHGGMCHAGIGKSRRDIGRELGRLGWVSVVGATEGVLGAQVKS